jgi:hypothetical protein
LLAVARPRRFVERPPPTNRSICMSVRPRLHYLVEVGIPAVAKLAILVVATLVGSLAVSALVLKRVPGLRRMF